MLTFSNKSLVYHESTCWLAHSPASLVCNGFSTSFYCSRHERSGYQYTAYCYSTLIRYVTWCLGYFSLPPNRPILVCMLYWFIFSYSLLSCVMKLFCHISRQVDIVIHFVTIVVIERVRIFCAVFVCYLIWKTDTVKVMKMHLLCVSNT